MRMKISHDVHDADISQILEARSPVLPYSRLHVMTCR